MGSPPGERGDFRTHTCITIVSLNSRLERNKEEQGEDMHEACPASEVSEGDTLGSRPREARERRGVVGAGAGVYKIVRTRFFTCVPIPATVLHNLQPGLLTVLQPDETHAHPYLRQSLCMHNLRGICQPHERHAHPFRHTLLATMRSTRASWCYRGWDESRLRIEGLDLRVEG